MQVRVAHRGELSELTDRFPAFLPMARAAIPLNSARRWHRPGNEASTYDATVVFIGKTGYGKSSTINALSGLACMQTSAVAGCTREPASIELKVRDHQYLSLIDLPGIGESEALDAQYFSLYSRILQAADAVVYLLRADTRDYSIDERALSTLFDEQTRARLVVALNCCDKVEPISRSALAPTPEQLVRIREKVAFIERSFDVHGRVVPISADTVWNLPALAGAISATVLRSLAAHASMIDLSSLMFGSFAAAAGTKIGR